MPDLGAVIRAVFWMTALGFLFCSVAAGFIVAFMTERVRKGTALQFLGETTLCAFGAATGIIVLQLAHRVLIYGVSIEYLVFAVAGALAVLELYAHYIKPRKRMS